MSNDTVIENNGTGVLERHAQTILTAVVAGLIGWVGFSVTEQGKMMAALTERVTALQVQVEKMSLNPSITREDFTILIQSYSQKTALNKVNIDRLEKRMEQVESDLYVKYVNPHSKRGE